MNNAAEILRTLLAQGTIEQADIDEVERSHLSEDMKSCVTIIHDLFCTADHRPECTFNIECQQCHMDDTWAAHSHQQWIMRTKEILDNAGVDTKVDDLPDIIYNFRSLVADVEMNSSTKTAALLQAYLNTHNNAATCDQKMNGSGLPITEEKNRRKRIGTIDDKN